MLHRALDFDRFIGTDSAKKSQNEIWHMEHEGSLSGKLLIIVAREIAGFMLDIAGVKEVRCDRGGTEQADDIHISMEMRIMN
jgi:hypothetical protein